jgi:hypothetical protein
MYCECPTCPLLVSVLITRFIFELADELVINETTEYERTLQLSSWHPCFIVRRSRIQISSR